MNLADQVRKLGKDVAEIMKLLMNIRASGGGGGGGHNICSATHLDTTIGAVQRGDLLVGSAVPTWARKAKGAAGELVGYDANDVVDVDPATLDVDKVDGLDAAAFALASHHAEHELGGGDAIKLDDLSTPDDNTDLDASTTRHGLLRKLDNNPAHYLDGQGGWTEPGGGGGGGDSTYKGTDAARPAPSNDGDLYFPTDGLYIYRDTGAAWQPWGPIFPCIAPINGDFAWVNQGGASVDTTYGGVFLLAPAGAGDNCRIRKKAAPSTPYTITALFLPRMFGIAYCAFGLVFRNASSGSCHTFSLTYIGNFLFASTYWTNATTWAGDYWTGGGFYEMLEHPVWLRIADNGTNRICSWSTDGRHWLVLHTIGRTDWLTADEVGFYVNANNATWNQATLLLSWEEG